MPCDLVTVTARDIRRLDRDRLIVVDTSPANPATIDAAIEVADIVIVPSAPSLADLDRTWQTLRVASGRPAAVLLTQVNTQTSLYEQTRKVFDEADVLVFPTPILRRESFRQSFRHWPKDGVGLVGYDDVYREIMKAVA